MSIRILLDHGVCEDHIVVVTFLVALEGGISVLRKAFPKIKVVCAAVDNEMREAWIEGLQKGGGGTDSVNRRVWVMQPGMGQIGQPFPPNIPFIKNGSC